jgi:peptidoglycan/LPS O-acetylase OafA/YrhL
MTEPTTAARSSARLPALDGLRGFALLGMLAWHAEVTWIRGGFARMTIFFVLAGFLATLSLRRAAPGGRGFLSFWGRRARRLLPMTIIGIVWAVAVTALVGTSYARQSVVGDALATIGSVANWRFIFTDRPYGALFESGTAFQHYWSLSLEEQSFLVLPLILAGAALVARGRHRLRLGLIAALAVACGLLPLVFAMSEDAAYYGTHVRLGEFLFGVLLAEIFLRWDPAEVGPVGRRCIGAAGTAGLAVLVATMVLVDREQAWLYQGGLIVFALPAVAVIAAVWVGSRAVTMVLAIVPLAVLGRWALSVYVLHWPLYQLLDQGPFGLEGSALVAAQLASAVLVGGLAYQFVERPLLRLTRVDRPATPPVEVGPRPAPEPVGIVYPLSLSERVGAAVRRRPVYLAVPGVALAVVAAVLVPPLDPIIDFQNARADSYLTAEEAMALLEGRDGIDPPADRDENLIGVAMFGGSGAVMLSSGTEAWAEPHRAVQAVPGFSAIGCGLMTGGLHRPIGSSPGRRSFIEPPPACPDWDLTWPATVVRNRADIAVLPASVMDLFE